MMLLLCCGWFQESLVSKRSGGAQDVQPKPRSVPSCLLELSALCMFCATAVIITIFENKHVCSQFSMLVVH